MRVLFFILMICFLVVPFAFSADPSSEDTIIIIKEHNKIQNSIERERRAKELKETNRDVFKIVAPKKKKPKKIKGKLPCFFISTIILENSELLDEDEKEDFKSNYINKCIDMNNINELVRMITNHYIGKGYSTARVRVPVNQDLKSGTLKLIIFNGIIEDIVFGKNDLFDEFKLFTAFPFLEGKPLNLKDIEQGIEQFNRLASNNATLKIIPGEKQNGSKVEITNNPQKTFRVNLAYDNEGQKSTGEYRTKYTIAKDNLFQLNDSITYNRTDDTEDDEDTLFNKYESIDFSLPFGYWTFSFNYNRSEYLMTQIGESSEFKSSGNSQSGTYTLNRVLKRGQTSKTSFVTSLTIKETESYIDESKIDVSSRRLSIGKLELAHSDRFFSSSWNFNLAYFRGINDFGARNDNEYEILDDSPLAQFDKYTLDVSCYKPLQVFKQNFTYKFNFTGQFSPDVLFGSEKISVGGLGSVRGFKEDSISGDYGYYARNELSYSIPELKFLGSFSKSLNGLQLFTAFDFGYVRENAGEEANSGEWKGGLQGWAAGIRYYGKYLTMDVSWAVPQSGCPDYVEKEHVEEYFTFSLDLSEVFIQCKNKFFGEKQGEVK
jgi:hemolysin activation/secretion protein